MRNFDLNNQVSLRNSCDNIPPADHAPIKAIELYKENELVYLKGARGVDPKAYKIYQVLGNGQYKLSRDAKSDGKIYRQEDLRNKP